MAKTLLDKVWDAPTVRTLPSGQTQLLIGLHLIHEVTTPQAFQMLRDSKLKVRMPERTFGTLDHIIPTTDQTRPYADPLAEEMAVHMIRNMKDFSLPLFDMSTGKQGIVHVIGPELGLTQPGMTIACGDSHTSTHGAVGAIALGLGPPAVRAGRVVRRRCAAGWRRYRADGDLGHQPGHVGGGEPADSRPRVGARVRSLDLPRSARPHELPGRPADQGREDRRRVRRLVHQ